ncbi:MAG: response regulator [Candidatus Micrarchaeota archaeon]|nr:response regulator [Candidatus Micrarchaeota archaeon]
MAKKILVVDDDFEDLETMKSILEKAGFSVSAATNGARALDILKKDKCDLLLIDIRMPTLSGYDLLQLLREKLSKDVKMVYVSILPKQEVDLQGADGFIQKPFSPSSFLKEVKKVLK